MVNGMREEPQLSNLCAGVVPPDWTDRFGPLAEVGHHAGVQVLRGEGAAGSTRFLKVHDDAQRGQREASVLNAGLPVVTPGLEFAERTATGQLVLCLTDVRHGAPRPRRLGVDSLGAAAALLASVHDCRVEDVPGGGDWARWVDQLGADRRLPGDLRRALSGLPAIGDGFCHGDLHPSNWVMEHGNPVGLLDWSACRYADPESDLASLLMAAGGSPEPMETVCRRWESHSGRFADRARVWLYLWWEVEQAIVLKGDGARPELRALATRLADGWPQQPPPHGTDRVPRLVAKPDAHADDWVPVAGDTCEPLRRALARPTSCGDVPVDEIAVFDRHSCNDVVRLRMGGTTLVAKVYNKRLPSWLLPLEAHLAQALRGGPALVPPPLPLANRGPLLRIEGRPTALYAYAGARRLPPTPEAIERLAAAQAALDALDDLGDRFPELPRVSDGPDERLMAGSLHKALRSDELDALASAFDWLSARAATVPWREMPRALLHGSLHCDHATALQGRIVLFDLEKVRLGPRLLDVVNTAYFVAYRNNDGRMDEGRLHHYLQAYHRRQPLKKPEKSALLVVLLACFFHDLKALQQEGDDEDFVVRHARLLLRTFDRRTALMAGIDAVLR